MRLWQLLSSAAMPAARASTSDGSLCDAASASGVTDLGDPCVEPWDDGVLSDVHRTRVFEGRWHGSLAPELAAIEHAGWVARVARAPCRALHPTSAQTAVHDASKKVGVRRVSVFGLARGRSESRRDSGGPPFPQVG